MKKYLLLFVFAICVWSFCWGQTTWQKTYVLDGFDLGYSMQLTSDGGFVVTGASIPIGEGEDYVYLLRADSSGNILWTEAFGNDVGEYGQSIQQCIGDGFIVVGSTSEASTGDSYINLTKIESNGHILWDKRYGNAGGILHGSAVGYSVQQTIDTGFIVAGWIYNFPQMTDVYLMKTHGNGDTLWTKKYGGNNEDYGYSIRQTTDSGFIVAGSTQSFGAGGPDVYLIKTDHNGDTLWSKTYGTIYSDEGYAVEQTSDKGFIVAGYTTNLITYDYDVYLIRTDSSGDTLWTRSYGGNQSDVAQDVHQTPDGGFIVTGYSNSNLQSTADVYVIKTDANGDTIWTKTFGGIHEDKAFSIHQTSDGGFLIGGYTQNFGVVYYGAYIIKTDTNGNSGCNALTTSTIVKTPPAITSQPLTLIGSGAVDSTMYRGIFKNTGSVNTLCSTVGIQSEILNRQSEILLSPNPFTSQLTLHFSNPQKEKAQLTIFNSIGEKVLKKEIVLEDQTLNLCTLPQGIYLVSVRTDKEVWTEKIVK